MARELHQVSTYLLIALVVVHTSHTMFFNAGFSVVAMCFASAGLAMIIVGFLKIARRAKCWLITGTTLEEAVKAIF